MRNLNMDARDVDRLRIAASQAGEIFDRQRGGITLQPDAGRRELSLFSGNPFHGARAIERFTRRHQCKHRRRSGRQKSLGEIPQDERRGLRSDLYLALEATGRLNYTAAEQDVMREYRAGLQTMTRHIPAWVKFAVALALGLGTMINKRAALVNPMIGDINRLNPISFA